MVLTFFSFYSNRNTDYHFYYLICHFRQFLIDTPHGTDISHGCIIIHFSIFKDIVAHNHQVAQLFFQGTYPTHNFLCYHFFRSRNFFCKHLIGGKIRDTFQ